MITTLGKEYIANRMLKTPTQQHATNIAIGTGSPSSTALGTELRRKAAAITVSGNEVTYSTRFDIDDYVSGTITEIGVFNSPSLGGTMLSSGTCSVVKGKNDELTVNIKVII